MKKILKLTTLACSILIAMPLFTSCNSSTYKKFRVTYGTYAETSAKEIDYGDLKKMIKTNKESFCIAVYPLNYTSCSCWTTFSYIIDDYVKNQHIKIYKISYAQMEANKADGTFGIGYNKDDPSFSFVEKGTTKKVLDYHNGTEVSSFFKDMYSFKNEMDISIEKPNLIELNKTELDNHISNDKSFSVIYSRCGCGDCSDILPNFLFDYTSALDMKQPLYVFDAEDQGIYVKEDQTEWEKFKTDYKLTDTASPKYGYLTGKVPTFYHYSNGTLDDGAMYVNETVSKQGEKYVITENYYTQERLANIKYEDNVETKILLGLEIPESDITTYPIGEGQFYYQWKYEAARKYYGPLISAFLNLYCL